MKQYPAPVLPRSVVLACTLLLACAPWCTCQDKSNKTAGTREELQKLQATWSYVSRMVAGKQVLGEEPTALCVVRGKQVVFKVGAEVQEVGEIRIVDASANPKKMDILITGGPNKGRTVLAIYEVKGDTFRYCASEAVRPQTFTTHPDDKAYIHCSTFRRVKH
jgi:uncharacterized protein (TIGR03067 family)